MRGRGVLVAYSVGMAGLWLFVFGLSQWFSGGGWDRGPAVLFALMWVGMTVTLYWVWRLAVLLTVVTARAAVRLTRRRS